MVATPPYQQDCLAKARASTLFVLWTTYGSFYFCRVNIGPAVTSIRRDLGFTAIEMGLVLGAVKLGYACGQLVNGQLTERFGARRILGVGMIGSAVATLLMAGAPGLAALPWIGGHASILASAAAALGRTTATDSAATATLGVMIALAFVNGWFQAGGWPPCVKIAGHWFALAHRGRTMGILGTSYTVGSAVAILFVGWLLAHAGGSWRVAFVAPPFIVFVSFLHTFLRLRERPPRDPALPPDVPNFPAPSSHLKVREALLTTLGNRRIWILALGLFGVDAVRYGFLDWAPGHLSEIHRSGALSAALKTAVFPLAGAAGTLSSGWVTDRFFQSRRAPVCAILLAAVGGLTLAYRSVAELGAAPTVVCLGLVGFCIYGAQILLVGTAAQDFAKRDATASAVGFVDFMGHVGAFSGDVVTGWALRNYGWGGAIVWWACAGLVAAVLVATLWRVRPHDGSAMPAPAAAA